MSKKPARLDISNDSGFYQQFICSQDLIQIGRKLENDLVLSDDAKISRHHSQIAWQDGSYVLIDLGSKSGTSLNGQRLVPNQPCKIHDQDLIIIGNFRLQFVGNPNESTEISDDSTNFVPGVENSLELDLAGYQTLTVGRDLQNGAVINHPSVSRYHAQIEQKDGAFYIRDLSSTNGTFVNGKALTKSHRLRAGDSIRIGSCRLVLNIDNTLVGINEEGNLRLDAVALKKIVGKQSVTLLNNISLSILSREFVVVAGVSGGGKSTLLDALNGLRPATSGKVLVNGTDLYKNFNAYRTEIGYVPQKDITHKALTIQQSLSYAAKLRMPADTSAQEYRTRIDEVLDDLELTQRKDVPVENLSGGQLKRVSMGVELLTKPSLFFLDEATSGLDPGTESEIMRLLRKLANQGRTILLITHATENVTLCDLVIFLAAGGRVAYFGPPQEAPKYFEVENFNQIYRKVERERSPEEWQQRYLQSKHYQTYIVKRQSHLQQLSSQAQKPLRQAPQPGSQVQRVSPWKQLLLLTSRNLDILRQDKASLFFMLAIAPILGILDFFIWPRNLFNFETGDPQQTLMMLFVAVIIAIMVGSLSSMREIVKENDIFRRERMVCLQLWPYIFSKVLTGIIVSLYQAAVFTLFKFLVVQFPEGLPVLLGIYCTLLLATIGGMMMGLLVSAIAPNQNVAPLLIILVLIPQITLGGGLLPIQSLPFPGRVLSHVTFSRWAFESMVTITNFGESIANDSCYPLPKDDRDHPSEAQKVEQCSCLGPNLFTKCDFPGIKDEANLAKVNEPEPQKPDELSSFPEPPSAQALSEYKTEVDQYQKDIDKWQVDYSQWKKEREGAIGEGEGIIKQFHDNYGKSFAVNLYQHWGILGGLSAIFCLGILPIQKRKSIV